MSAPTSTQPTSLSLPSRRGEPTWEMALSHPTQGEWTEEQYLAMGESKLIEFSDGCLEFLPMPSIFHQNLVEFLFLLLREYVNTRALGRVYFAPMPVRLGPAHFREPDIMYFRPERIRDPHRQPNGADLVMEVVSPGTESRERDLQKKRIEYAQAGITEYWIVDPEQKEVTVLALDGNTYRLHGIFRPGDEAASAMFPDFRVPVGPLFQAGEPQNN